MGCGCVVTGFRTSTVLGCSAFRVCSKDFASKPLQMFFIEQERGGKVNTRG